MRQINRLQRTRGILGNAATAVGLLLAASVTFAWQEPETPVPQDERVFVVDEAQLPFEALADTEAEQRWGIHKAAGYRIEIPAGWNGGDLMMFAHGFRGGEPELTVDSPPEPMRRWLLDNGIAWAASSYSRNFYDVRSGVESTNDLARYFGATVGEPNRTFITGFSMGGHVTGAAIEMYPNVQCPAGPAGRFCRRVARVLGKLSGGVDYDGAAPFCGVMGDLALVNYFGDVTRGAEALTGVTLPQLPPPEDYYLSVFPQVLAGLADPEIAAQHVALTEVLSGGPRPGFAAAYGVWRDFLFGFAGGAADFDGIVVGNLYGNLGRRYQLDTDPALTPEEVALNEAFIRVTRDQRANPERFLQLQRVPEITGRLTIPVVSTHTLGDLFVPFSMQQIYAREASRLGRSQYLVSRATRAVGHCEFSGSELVAGVADMVAWADGGPRPRGDRILKPELVADPNMGCAHSITDAPTDAGGAPSPASRALFAACPSGG